MELPQVSPSVRFISSVNKEVTKYLNPTTGKIASGGNFSAFNSNWEPVEASIEDISADVLKGAGLCAWHLVGGRRTRNDTDCIKAGLLILDIDNQDDSKDESGNKIQRQELTVEQALQLEICTRFLSFAYKSPSDTESWPRFRLVFGLGKPILDPEFYRWLVLDLAAQIPGSDRRATQTVNLFYGNSAPDALITITDKYIPESYIDAKYVEYLAAPKESESTSDLQTALSCDVDPGGVDIEQLVNRKTRDLLDGEPATDRSADTAIALKELIGWSNWLRTAGIPAATSPLDTANHLFYNVYGYDSALDGKLDRILRSIPDPESLLPSIALAADEGDLAPWRRIKKKYRELYEQHCPLELKEQIATLKPAPKNSVLSINLNITPDSLPASVIEFEPEMTQQTPDSPVQLMNLQGNGGNQQNLSEDDIADIIVKNYADVFLFDSKVDEFYSYDEDEGVWFLSDEHHTKKRITKTLDTFKSAGVIQRYNSAFLSSIHAILKAKLLRSVNSGRESIWSTARGKIPFANGVLDAKSLEFSKGNHREYYFQTKLGFSFDASAKCPEILKWLEWAVGTEKIILIRAFCRALLTGYTSGERFLHLIGPGGSGKSTLQQLLIALAGYTGTHTSDLETIETNRFECHSLMNKRLLLLTDEASFSKRLDTLKKLTSATDTLRAERKYGKEVINFKPEILVSIASNEHIASSDLSSGLERRRLTIVMDKVIDPSLRRNLISVYPTHIEGEFVKELPGFAQWLLEMPYDLMRDVLANPTKHVPALQKSNLDALVFNNHLCAFLADCTVYAPNSHAILGNGAFRPSIDESEKGLYVKNAFNEVYAAYVNYCKANSYKCNGKAKFIERLKETVNHVLKVPGIDVKLLNGRPVVTGIRLRPYDPSTDRAVSGANRLPSPVEFAADRSCWEAAFEEHDKPST